MYIYGWFATYTMKPFWITLTTGDTKVYMSFLEFTTNQRSAVLKKTQKPSLSQGLGRHPWEGCHLDKSPCRACRWGTISSIFCSIHLRYIFQEYHIGIYLKINTSRCFLWWSFLQDWYKMLATWRNKRTSLFTRHNAHWNHGAEQKPSQLSTSVWWCRDLTQHWSLKIWESIY